MTGFDQAIESVADLRDLYADPSARATGKQIDHLDDHCREFIARAPFLVMATADADGRSDVSPKGGPPGFVTVLDDHRLAWGDLSGNNRLDSFTNLMTNAGVGLLFMIPGIDETLRVNGRAALTRDADVLAACALDGRSPKVAVGVTVEEAYIHCAKAFRRGAVWRPEDWPDTEGMPSIACMLRDQARLEGVSADDVAAALERSYEATLWETGGTGSE